MVASDDAAAAQPAQHLAAVRLKPLPARRLAMRVAGVVPVGASGSCSSLEAPIAGAAHLQAQQRPSVPPPSRLIRPEAAGRGGGGGAGAYRMSLRATVDAHQALLARMEKTVQAMHATARTKKLAEMMQQEDAVAHSLTIHPTHLFRCVWRCVLVLVVLYYNLAVPLRIMARYDCGVLGYTTAQCLSSWDWSLVIDYLCDAVVLAEFLLQAQFFAFRRYEGDKVVIETDSRAIWAHFTSSEVYPLLVLLIFPVDVLAPLTGYLLCLRVAKVPSILLLSSVIQELQQWLDQERGVSISAEAVTVAHLSVNTTLVTVWMAVGWCILHYGGAQSSNWISALYWTLTSITTTGYGDITPVNTGQTVYNVCVSIVGPTIFATIIAKFSSYVKK